MKSPMRCLLIACIATLSSLVFDGLLNPPRSASAQSFGRGRDGGRDGGESREERRERWRRSYGGGEGGGRDWRGRGGDDDRGSDNRSNGSGSSGSGSSSSSDSKSAGASAASLTTTSEWAKKLVEEKDKNGNHWLDGEELKGLGGSTAKSDLNNDGVITVDELVQHSSASAAAATTTAPSTTTSSSGSTGSGDSSRRDGDRRKGDTDGSQRVFTGSAGGPNAKEGDKRRTYRFSTAADRLPSSLPSFFSRDKNGDGQVSMSEYSRSWSKSTVAEFRRHDLNDDGMITAKEATKSSGSGG
jgi:hypothetical protein